MNRKMKTLPFTVAFRISEDDKKHLDRMVLREQTNHSEFVRLRILNLINNNKKVLV